jgi:hypothetical protein
MSTFTWPTTDLAFSQLSALVWKPRVLSRASESPLNGDVQTVSRPGSRWGLSLTFFPQTWAERRRVIAFLERLNGQQHRISFIDPTNPSPQGTIALSGVTMNATAAQFAESIQLANCGAGATIKRGDWLKVGGQAVKCVVDATADGSGVMTVPIRHMLRASAASGASVTTNNVSALYILADPNWTASYNGSHADPFAIDLIEVFS